MPELTEMEQIRCKISDLQEQLLSAHPQMPSLLRQIHTALHKDNSLVQQLTEDEIAVVVKGLERQTGIHITTTAAKTSTASAKKKHANLTVDDL